MVEAPVLGGCIISRPARIKSVKQGFTLLSDLHIGAPQVDYKLINKELEAAKKNGDRILINGDVFDMILPKDHKRFSPDALHPRLQGRPDVVGAQIEWGVETLAPYVDQIDMIGCGNHEEAVTRHHSFDPLSALISHLNGHKKNKEHVIHYGGYSGFVDYRFGHEEDGKRGGYKNRRFVCWYHHGSGGSAPVTRGMIDLHRTGWITADLIWLGHKHVRVTSHVRTLSCPLVGDDPTVKEVRQVITGGYFDTYRGQTQESIKDNGRRSNYAADRCMAEQGKGGARVMVELVRDRTGGSDTTSLELQVTQ